MIAAPDQPQKTVPVFAGAAFRVIRGANLGDGLGDATEIALGDTYALAPDARRQRLSVLPGAARLTVGEGGEVGTPGNALHLDAVATFMSPDGAFVDALILVETTPELMIAAVHLLPLADMAPRRDYAVVSLDTEGAAERFGQLGCIAFTAGTHITLASGAQVPIEELKVGDRVLTRDHGPRPVRWIGQQTVRATGDMAPILIRKGALNNARDLVVSPNHRLFIYQRRDRLRAGRREVLVKARYLVNGRSVVQSDGGFVDYYQLLFDAHEIIYAEGIAAESLMVDTHAAAVLPPEVREWLEAATTPREGPHAMDLPEGLIDSATAADLLRQSSAC